MCNYVDPSSDAFVSKCITSSGKDILPDLVAGVEPWWSTGDKHIIEDHRKRKIRLKRTL